MTEVCVIGSDDSIEEEGKMQFRLLYEGELESSGNKRGMGPAKHAIRRALHPQLRRLWQVNNDLRRYAVALASREDKDIMSIPRDRPIIENLPLIEAGIKSIGRKWRRCGYDFVPLLTEDLAYRCSLDILILGPRGQQIIKKQGDIDGRLKTLFDALRLPKNSDEIGTASIPTEDESPFYCLLENDNLITEIHITTDELLLLPNHKEVGPNDVFVVMNVSLNYKSDFEWITP